MDEAARARIEDGLRRVAGRELRLVSVTPLAGGASQELLRLQLEDPQEGALRLVLRGDAPRGLPGSLDRRREHAVVVAAVGAGVETPAPRWLASGLLREGAWSYCLEWVEGEALGAKVVRDPALAEARAALPGELAVQLARIHTVTPGLHPQLSETLGPPPADPAREALAGLSGMLGQLPGREPAFALLLAWLEAHLPGPTPPVLVHGDFRVGNFLVGPAGLRAVLDWEFAHWGSPAEDLAWIALRDWRFGRLEQPVGGICARAALWAPYAAASGRAVDPAEVHWWEVCGNVRWAAGSLCQGERYLSGAQRDLELLAIARRAPEILWEAMRLAERGVSAA